jgi:uncharacterized protein YfaS (alpha-2-macroglobulin family)
MEVGTEFMGHYYRHHPIQWLERELHIMTAPTNGAVSFDKSTYNLGDTVTATITWDSGEAVTTVTVNVSIDISNQNSETTSVTGSFVVATEPGTDTFTVKASDDGNRTWDVTMGSDGVSATATTTA